MTPVREHYRHKPYEKVKAAKTEQLWDEMVSRALVKELESSLAETFAKDGRDFIERVEQTY